MRRLLCGIFAGVLGISPAVAQQVTGSAPLSVGVSLGGGIPLTPMSPDYIELDHVSHIRTDVKAGFISGTSEENLSLSVFLRLPRNNWFLQPELAYQHLLSSPITFDVPSKGPGPDFFGSEKYHNFEVDQLSTGVLAGYYVDAGRHFYLLAGPAVGLRISGYDYGNHQSTALGEELRTSLNHAPASTRYFLHGGAGYWGHHFNIEARVGYGLTPLVRSLTFRDKEYGLQAQGHFLLLTFGGYLNFKKLIPHTKL